MPDKKEQTLSVRVQDVIVNALNTLVKDTGRPLSWHIRQALIIYIFVKMPHILPKEMRERYERKNKD